MALTSIAEGFYPQSLHVVIVDWDLEAPGLQTFFFRNAAPKNGAGRGTDVVLDRLSLLDMLTEYKRSYADLRPQWTSTPQPTAASQLATVVKFNQLTFPFCCCCRDSCDLRGEIP